MTFFEFFKKMPKMILEVLTLRLFWGLKSLNFKTFKIQFLDLVLKVLTLRPPSCQVAEIVPFSPALLFYPRLYFFYCLILLHLISQAFWYTNL